MPPEITRLLIEGFAANAYDLAGLADIEDDGAVLDCCLRCVADALRVGGGCGLFRQQDLAAVVYALVRVAQEDYGDDTSGGYWPHLSGRLGAVLGRPVRLAPPECGRLGTWFCDGLERFGYVVPPGGQTNLGPILWHAGCPRHQLSHLLRFVVACVAVYGERATEPDALHALQVGGWAARWSPPLPRSVLRLLTQNPDGAGFLWGRLACVVQAWRTAGEAAARDAWETVSGLTFDDVRRVLREEAVSQAGSQETVRRPQVCYDSATGEVRLWLVEGRKEDWTFTDLAPRWQGNSAVLDRPLPPRFVMRHTPSGRVWEEVAWVGDRPAVWFNAASAVLHRGSAVENRGLEAGRWFLLARGEPSEFRPNQRLPLTWAYLRGGDGWAAWEVEVPGRSTGHGGQAALSLSVGGEVWRFPLARGGVPRWSSDDEPVARGELPDGAAVVVYPTPPRLRTDSHLPVRLLRTCRGRSDLVGSLVLGGGAAEPVPAPSPGLYQIREARGSARELLRFALLPGFGGGAAAVAGADAVVELAADPAAGRFRGDHVREVGRGRWGAVRAAVEPWVEAVWEWAGADVPPIRFRWPVQAVRWRVVGANGETPWTCEPVLADRRRAAAGREGLEIQVPAGRPIQVNGVAVPAERVVRAATGDATRVELMSYPTADAVELQVGCDRHLAVLLSERPHLRCLRAEARDGELSVRWDGLPLPTGTHLAIWDPLDPATEPTLVSLDDAARRSGGWAGQMPGSLLGRTHISVSLGVRVGGGFGRVRARVLLAVQHSQGNALACCVSVGASDPMDALVRLAHRWTLGLTSGEDALTRDALADLNRISPETLPWAALVRYGQRLDQPPPHADRALWDRLRAALVLALGHAGPFALRALPDESALTEVLVGWLSVGVHPGWWRAAELVDLPDDLPADTGYPLGYFRDLRRIGSSDRSADVRAAAAERVWRFHADHELFSASAGLPVARAHRCAHAGGILWFPSAGHQGHAHAFRVNELPPDDPDQFVSLVVGDEPYLALGPARGDPFPRTPGPPAGRGAGRAGATVAHYAPTRYTVGRLTGEDRWQIERAWWEAAARRTHLHRCCSARGPLAAAPWTAEELVAHLRLREWLTASSRGLDAPQMKTPEAFDDFLFGAGDFAPVHRWMLQPPPQAPRVLFGQPVGAVPAYPDVPEAGKAAWRLAWVDRTVAWEDERAVQRLGGADRRRAFLSLLAVALRTAGPWSRLLAGCLAAADYILFLHHRRGLGPALCFADPPRRGKP